MAKKIISIQIDGEEKAFEVIDRLIEKVDILDKKMTSSKFASYLTEIFSSVQNISKGFGENIEVLNKTAEKIKPIVEAVKTLQEAEKKKNEEIEKGLKAEQKLLTVKREASTVTKLDLDNKNKIEAQVKGIEEKTKRYGDEIRFTTTAVNIYRKNYDIQAELYKNDAEKSKEALKAKAKYEEEYAAHQQKVQQKMANSINLYPKDDKGNSKFTDDIASIKHLEDVKSEAHVTDLLETKTYIKEKETILADHAKRTAELKTNMIEKEQEGIFAGRGYTDLKKTRENYTQLQEFRKKNIAELQKELVEIEKLYEKQNQSFKEGSEGQKAIALEKQQKIAGLNKQIVTEQEAMKNDTKEYYETVAGNVQNMYNEFDKYYNAIGGFTKNLLAYEIEGLKKDLEKTQKLLDEKTKAYQTHKNKVEELEKESATATGGRSIILQEQIAREMEARDLALKQQKEMEKEKAETEKQIKRKEKQQKKIDKVQELAQVYASQAMAIIKAWELGPIAGSIMSAVVAAATGLQIANFKRAWESMEDGGLLRGKRHSQGGMRIEGSNIEVEGGEYVVNRKSTNKNLGLIDFINRNRRELTPEDIKSYYSKSGKHPIKVNNQAMKNMYEDGGILTDLTTIDNASTQSVDTKILEAISQINFRPIVSVVDINNAQRTISEVKDVAGV